MFARKFVKCTTKGRAQDYSGKTLRQGSLGADFDSYREVSAFRKHGGKDRAAGCTGQAVGQEASFEAYLSSSLYLLTCPGAWG